MRNDVSIHAAEYLVIHGDRRIFVDADINALQDDPRKLRLSDCLHARWP